MLQRAFFRRDFPSATFQELQRGGYWISLTRHVESYLLVRDIESGDTFRLYVGEPQRIDPRRRYAYAPIAIALGASALSNAGGTGTEQAVAAPAVGTIETPDNDTELWVGDEPLVQSHIRGSRIFRGAEISVAGTTVTVIDINLDRCKFIELVMELITEPTGVYTIRAFSSLDLWRSDADAANFGGPVLESMFQGSAEGPKRHVYSCYAPVDRPTDFADAPAVAVHGQGGRLLLETTATRAAGAQTFALGVHWRAFL